MLVALGALVFAVAVLASVTLHEAGHFLTARYFGMKATRFFVGFGPTLFSRTRGETEYGVKAVPLGGFCTIVGMTPLEQTDPADADRVFYRRPAYQRFVVLVAGSTMHFIIAVVILYLGLITVGGPDPAKVTLGTIESCVPVDPVATTCTPTDPPGPAKAAGLRPGDRVVAIGGQPVHNYLGLVEAIRSRPGLTVPVEVERAGHLQTVTLTTVAVSRHRITDTTLTGPLATVGAIGVAAPATTPLYRRGPLEAVAGTVDLVGTELSGVANTLAHKLGTVAHLYDAHRDPAGFVGLYGAAHVSGDVLAAPDPGPQKIFILITIVAGINIFVGLFNLLPLLPLDGGHIAVVFYEKIRDTVRRRRGLSQAGPVDYAKLAPLTYAVAAVFLVFTVALLGADIVNPIKIN